MINDFPMIGADTRRKDKEVMFLQFSEGMPISEMCKKIGRSKRYVQKILKQTGIKASNYNPRYVDKIDE